MRRLTYLLAVLLTMPQSSFAAVTGQWDLQDNAASTVIVATVGTNAVLTNAGNTNGLSGNTAPVPGTLLTRYLLFPATNDYIVAGSGNGGVIQNTAQATLSCFFMCSAGDTTGSHTLIFISTVSAGNTRANIQLNSSGQISAAGRAGDADTVQVKTTTNSYDDGAWHHVAAVFDYANDAITIYVDGTSVAQTGTIAFTGTATSNTASPSVNIASTQSTTSSYGGRIAGVRISNSDDSADLAAIIALKDIPVTGPTITTSATQSLEESERDVVTVAATDGTTPYVWSITGGADQAFFAINSSTGALTMPGSADYETPEDADTNNVYVVEVTCTDDDTETDALTLNVTVTDEGGAGTGFSAGVNNGPVR